MNYARMNSTNPINPINIKTGYAPGAIGRITELHAAYYNREWGFGKFFEIKVATELAQFISRFDKEKDGMWIACSGNRVHGSIIIDGLKTDTQGAHLRWYILAPQLIGQGIGGRLLQRALQFCRSKRYNSVYLWTFAGLDQARHLYEKNGFKLVQEQQGSQWGTTVTEQKYVCEL